MAKKLDIPTLNLSLDYAASEITRLHDAVRAFVEPFSPPGKPLRQFILAMEEIVANAISYGKNTAMAAELTVAVRLEGETLWCEIIDNGFPFNPFSDAPDPDLTSSLLCRPLGGLGVHLTKQVVDSYSYQRRNERNHTILSKNMACRASAQPDQRH